MENTYSITVTNKFLLALDEDEDPLEILKLREQEREAKRKEKLSEKENKKHHSGQESASGTGGGFNAQTANHHAAAAANLQQQQQQQKAPAKQQQQQQKQPRSAAGQPNKENQHHPQQQPREQQQHSSFGGQGSFNQHPRNQDSKKDLGDKKFNQQKFGGDRNVKYQNESKEERMNRRNRENGDQPPRIQNDFKRGPPGEHKEPREPRERGGYREYQNSDRGQQEFGGERQGRGGGRGMGRGRGGGYRGRGNYDNRGKREFDRQSGSDKTYGYSGIKPIDKKDGAGSHNWGTHNDEIEESLNQATDDWIVEKIDLDVTSPSENKEGGTDAGQGEAGGEGGGSAPTEEKPVEEEARELTLDEWKALRQNRTKPQYNLRKAGEGEDLSRWKKMYALERKKEGEEEEEDDEEYNATVEYPQRVGRQKHVFDIEINFNDSRRSGGGGRGGRGGRGGGRGDRASSRGYGNRGPPRSSGGGSGGGGGGGPGDAGERSNVNEQRSPRERQNAPKVDDEHDFPSLG